MNTENVNDNKKIMVLLNHSTIYETLLKHYMNVLKCSEDDIIPKLEHIVSSVENYDEVFIDELEKHIASLEHQNKEIDYSKIIKKIHKKYKYMFDIYKSIVRIAIVSELRGNENIK